LPEEQRALGIDAVLIEGPDTPRGAAPGRLHLDDVSAQTGQRQPTVLGLFVRQLDDADPGQRPTAGREATGNRTLVLGCHRELSNLHLGDPTRRLITSRRRGLYRVRRDEARAPPTPEASAHTAAEPVSRRGIRKYVNVFPLYDGSGKPRPRWFPG